MGCAKGRKERFTLWLNSSCSSPSGHREGRDKSKRQVPIANNGKLVGGNNLYVIRHALTRWRIGGTAREENREVSSGLAVEVFLVLRSRAGRLGCL